MFRMWRRRASRRAFAEAPRRRMSLRRSPRLLARSWRSRACGRRGSHRFRACARFFVAETQRRREVFFVVRAALARSLVESARTSLVPFTRARLEPAQNRATRTLAVSTSEHASRTRARKFSSLRLCVSATKTSGARTEHARNTQSNRALSSSGLRAAHIDLEPVVVLSTLEARPRPIPAIVDDDHAISARAGPVAADVGAVAREQTLRRRRRAA